MGVAVPQPSSTSSTLGSSGPVGYTMAPALRECPRFVVGGHPKIIEKLSHNLPATLDFLLVGGSFARNAYLALGLERNAIGPRRFLCHGIHGFTGCLRMSSRCAEWNVSFRLAAAPAWPPLRPESAISDHRIYCSEVRTPMRRIRPDCCARTNIAHL